MSEQAGVPEPPPRGFHGMGAVLIFVGIAVMISLVWTQWQQAQRRGAQVLEVHGAVSPFPFSGAAGGKQTVLPDSRGDFLVVGVLSTREGGVAPMIMNRLKELGQKLDDMKEQRVRIAVITNDPDHDTPAVLAAYAFAAGVNPLRWSFLTGPAEGVKNWIQEDLFGPLLGEGEVFPSAPTRIVLMDGGGKIRAYRDAQNPGVVGNLLNDLGALDREFPESSGH